ncbi:hypothetical protein HMI54_010140 [Coelomomyces lativittatus]|nr:hypothetical protein HMI54_010140 [Coelomomyces lativittatus]KAJ1504700.1 hypothetical protein HMI55_001907 [Coelomomyces lativittatus]
MTLTQLEKINHLVVFLFGDLLPNGFGASVYLNFSLPTTTSSTGLLPTTPWQWMGYLSNEKQSAIFKLNPFKHPTFSSSVSGPMTLSTSHEDMALDDSGLPPNESMSATLGISIEPLDLLLQHMHTWPSSSSSTTMTTTNPTTLSKWTPPTSMVTDVALKLLQHLYNYVTSFATTTTTTTTPSSSSVLPLKVFEDWWQSVQRKVKMDPHFLMKEGEN